MYHITPSAFAPVPTLLANHRRFVPKGRLNGRTRVLNLPSGTYILGTTSPALKRRAIIGSPSGSTLQSTCICEIHFR
jgi:hypothetical protein